MRQPGLLRALLAASFYLCLTNNVIAQEQPVIFISDPRGPIDQRQATKIFEGPTLKVGTPIERKLGPKEAHAYSITLEENMYVQIVVEQRGIDLVVQVASSTGKGLGDFDSPNGTDGPENVSFVATTAGPYRVVVAPLNQQDTRSGMYKINIVELRQATEQEIKTSKNMEVVKANGLALLNDIDGILGEIRSPQTRIRAQLQVAQFLWPADEKRASKYLNDAANGVKEFLMVDPGSNEYVRNYGVMMQLRAEIITVLTSRDPEAALEFLRSSRMPLNPYSNDREQTHQEMALELHVAAEVAARDPKRALQIARDNLKKGLSPNLNETIMMLRQKSPEVATEFANEVVAKILEDKLLKPGFGAYLAASLMRGCRSMPAEPQKPGLNQPSEPRLLGFEKLAPAIQAPDQEQMNALLELARAFARYDSKRAFEIAEPLVEQANEICMAARTLDGFGLEFYQNDELDMENGNSVSTVVMQISSALGTLAITNFERAKSTADRLRLPEARLRAYLDIARQTIQAR